MTNTTIINSSIFKSYDVRGVFGKEWDEADAYNIGRALSSILKVKKVAVGRDMRISSPSISKNLINGLLDVGIDVINIGMVTTDMLYFAVGNMELDGGIMITASHNPKEYNGMKFCQKKAAPFGSEDGLLEIIKIINDKSFSAIKERGHLEEKDVYDDFVKHVLRFVDYKKIKNLKIVADAGNGMAGSLLPKVFENLCVELIPLYFELDGNFPNHPASPIELENKLDLIKKVKETKADLGVAFDGDGDRVFFIDNNGNDIPGSVITSMISDIVLETNPNESIVYNVNCDKVVPEILSKRGAKGIRTRVGHSFIKNVMKENNAIFGGEHSGHYYFRDNYFADSAIIATLFVLDLIAIKKKTLTELLKIYNNYFESGEINLKVENPAEKISSLKEYYKDKEIDTLDGISIDFGDWWFGVRSSNTEPLLRLNVKAKTEVDLKKRISELQAIINS